MWWNLTPGDREEEEEEGEEEEEEEKYILQPNLELNYFLRWVFSRGVQVIWVSYYLSFSIWGSPLPPSPFDEVLPETLIDWHSSQIVDAAASLISRLP